MLPDPLEIFSRQIAAWAEDLLEHGRYPFRKISVAPRVMTPAGEIRPDLVLWINRPSCMAGGVLFLPRGDAQEHYPAYAQAAQSLGLTCFAAWDTHAIEIRSTSPNYPLRNNFV